MKKANTTLFILAVLRMVLPFILQHPSYQPHRDAYLYLDYANHMDWGYMEVPPLLSVFSWLVKIAGPSTFWIKIWPALFGSLCFVLSGKIVIQLGGRRFALIILFLCFLFGPFLRLFHLFQPGFLEVFSWTLISYCIIQYIHTNNPRWAYAFGIACGIGLLSKYTTLFFLTGFAISWLITGRGKKLFSKSILIAACMAILLFLPNIIWQYQHRFPVIHHMEELRETQLQYINQFSFIIDQVMMMLPVAFIWITGIVALYKIPSFKPYRWLGWQWLIVLLLLLAGSGKSYYALGLYPVLFAFGSLSLASWLQSKKLLVKIAVFTPVVLLGIFSLTIALPVFAPQTLADFYEKIGLSKMSFFYWEDLKPHPLPQDFADMIGWKETAAMAAKQYHRLPQTIRDSTMIYCRGYYTAGALNLYRHENNMPEAYSDNGSYLLWMPDTLHFRHLMMIGHTNPGPDDEVFNHFHSRIVLDSLYYPLFRENGIKVFFFHNTDDSAALLANKSIRQLMQQFSR